MSTGTLFKLGIVAAVAWFLFKGNLRAPAPGPSQPPPLL